MKVLQILRILYLAILAGAMIFFGVVLFLKSNSAMIWINEDNPGMFLTGIIVVIVTSMCAFILPKMLLNQVRSKENKEQRLKSYIPVAIVRFALLEASMLVCIVFFLIDGSWFFTLMLALIVLIYLGLFPTQTRIENETETQIDDFTEDTFDD